MCMELPKVAFIAMDARHCAGSEMAELMAYGASVGAAKGQGQAPMLLDLLAVLLMQLHTFLGKKRVWGQCLML